jgi:multiple sugar transport system permease protein
VALETVERTTGDGARPLPGERRSRRARRRLNREAVAGWLFVAPSLLGVAVFLLAPVAIALWTSFRDWNGIGPPGESNFIGLENYRDLLSDPGIPRSDFALAIRNNLYYVIGVVTGQTVLAFGLALIVNQRFLRGKTFFRGSFYFPSITSSIAIALIFIFLFQRNGAVNAVVGFVVPGDASINWLDNANGIGHNLFAVVGVDQAPGVLADNSFMGQSLWTWLAGPSVTMLAIMILSTWTSTGGFMLIFLAGLQNVPEEVDEAAVMDGASNAQRFRYVTLPMMKPTLFLVLTLGIIGTWQVFDQIFAISAGGPQKTTLTPAYLVYREGFKNFGMGRASAVAFLLFLLIVAFTLVQRRVLKPEEF